MLNLIGCSDNSSEVSANNNSSVAKINDGLVAGKVRDTKFEVEKAIIEDGTLSLDQSGEDYAWTAVNVVTSGGGDMSGRVFSTSDSNSALKHYVNLYIKKGGESLTHGIMLTSDYELFLAFGEKEYLGIPFSIKLISIKNGTAIEGNSFATYKDIRVVDGVMDLKFDSFDTLEHLAKEYIKKQYGEVEIGARFGITSTSYGSDYPQSGFVGYEVEAVDQSIMKIQLAKDENGWKVVNELKASQVHQAHPVVTDVEGNLRTVEEVKATAVAARKFEEYLNDKSLIDTTRATSVRCDPTETAHRASCMAIYGLLVNDKLECRNINYLLINDGKKWSVESEILVTQKLDYTSGAIITNKRPLYMSCL